MFCGLCIMELGVERKKWAEAHFFVAALLES